jgi:hypothetical protein
MEFDSKNTFSFHRTQGFPSWLKLGRLLGPWLATAEIFFTLAIGCELTERFL